MNGPYKKDVHANCTLRLNDNTVLYIAKLCTWSPLMKHANNFLFRTSLMKIVSINKHVFIWQSVQEDTPLSIFEMLTKSQGSKNTSV